MGNFSWGSSGKIYVNPADATASDLLAPIIGIAALPLDGTAFAPPRKIIADKAGTCTITDYNGNTHTSFPLTGLEQNIACTAISNIATSTKVWGLY